MILGRETVKMKRRMLLTVFVMLMSLFVLTGCQQGGSTDDAAPAPDVKEVREDKEDKEDKDDKEDTAVTVSEDKPELDTAAAGESLKKMSDALSGFLWVSMMKDSGYNPMEEEDTVISLSDEEKMRAAVLASNADGVIESTFVLGMGGFSEDKNADDGPDGDGFYGVSVSEKDVEENCRDLFGYEVSWDDLPIGPVCDLYDAVMYSDGKNRYPMIVERVVETETDLKNHECTVTEEDGRYIGKVNMFWGYWGELEMNPGYSNYVATYVLEPDERSKYGMVITSISINRTEDDPYERTDDESADGQDTGFSTSSDAAYYGVFVKAFKNEEDCSDTLRKLEDAGFTDCPVIYTPGFEKLNPEPYYVVTAGLFASEQEADETLDKVKASGFKDAYVKYAGYYIGD